MSCYALVKTSYNLRILNYLLWLTFISSSSDVFFFVYIDEWFDRMINWQNTGMKEWRNECLMIYWKWLLQYHHHHHHHHTWSYISYLWCIYISLQQLWSKLYLIWFNDFQLTYDYYVLFENIYSMKCLSILLSKFFLTNIQWNTSSRNSYYSYFM